jgi:hypothetical protein
MLVVLEVIDGGAEGVMGENAGISADSFWNCPFRVEARNCARKWLTNLPMFRDVMFGNLGDLL